MPFVPKETLQMSEKTSEPGKGTRCEEREKTQVHQEKNEIKERRKETAGSGDMGRIT